MRYYGSIKIYYLYLMHLEELLKKSVEKGASDIHIIVGKPPMVRISGVLQPIDESMETILASKSESLAYSVMSAIQREKFLSEREIDLSYESSDGSRFRINVHWERGNVGLVARIIPHDPPTMEGLLMPEVVYNFLNAKQGLVLVTGPTGCGKSTSLAAMIEHINQNQAVHIVTLEDPIEFVHESKQSLIRQRQLGEDMLSFSNALKRVLRQDPNVILVGEMRDLESIAATITLAETGHLVLATLHTFNASQTVDRIIDVFPPHQQNQVRMQLSLFLKGVISQQLITRIGGGRVASREIMVNNPAVANLIRENKISQIRTTIQTCADQGMVTMDQDIKRLVKEKIIDRETAIAYMMNPEQL